MLQSRYNYKYTVELEKNDVDIITNHIASTVSFQELGNIPSRFRVSRSLIDKRPKINVSSIETAFGTFFWPGNFQPSKRPYLVPRV